MRRITLKRPRHTSIALVLLCSAACIPVYSPYRTSAELLNEARAGSGPVGGAYGILNYLPEEQVEEVDRTLERAAISARELKLRAEFARELLRLGNERTHREFLEMSAEPPQPSATAGATASARVLLTIRLVRAGLKGLYQIDPPSSAFLEIEARLVRTSDDVELLSATMSCHSDRRTYLQWGSDEGQALIDSVARCVPLLAEKVIDDVFLVHPMPSG